MSRRSKDPDSAGSWETTKRLLGWLTPYRVRVAGCVLLALTYGLFSAATIGGLYPVLEAVLKEGGLTGSLSFLRAFGEVGESLATWVDAETSGRPMRAIGFSVAGLITLATLGSIFKFLHEYAVVSVCQRTQLDLAESLYGRITRQDESTLARVGLSNLSARFSYDLDMTGKALETLVGTLILEPARFVWYLIVALMISTKLLVVALFVVPLVLGLGKFLGKRIRKSAEGMLDKRARLLGRVQETVAALPAVQIYGQEAAEQERFVTASGRVYAWAKRLARLDAASHSLLELLSVVGIAPVILFGAWLVVQGEIDFARFIMFYMAIAAVYAPLRKTVGASNRLQGGVAGAARIFGTMDLPSDVRERSDARDLPPVSTSVSWEDVLVRYPDGRVALHGVTVEAPAGRTTALVGPSGAGKTTLLHTLPRLLDVTEGAVRLDGVDIRDAKLGSLRGRMALVTQSARLFGGTLADNVAYARPSATRAEVEAAGRVARVDEIVARLPQGWDTVLDESGAGLSGGERQRVAIARAVLRDPQILLLDEPTSALDPENERLVQEALTELARGRTTIIVAHRAETVRQADHVVVLRAGEVEAVGSAQEIEERSATFRELFGTRAAKQPTHTPQA